MQVAVIKSDQKSRWYANRIGEIFEVVGEQHNCFEVKAQGYRKTKLIRKENVEVVEDLVNLHRMYWSSMSTGKYDLAPSDQLDKDVKATIERYKQRKIEIKNLLVSEINKNPFNQKETFSMIIEILREIKQEKEL